MWTAVVWNMGLGSPPSRRASKNWKRLDELIREHSVDVALLNEAPVTELARRRAAYSTTGTEGWDLRRDNGRPRRRAWSAAVVSTDGEPTELTPLAVGSSGRRPNVAFRSSKPGTWAAGLVEAPGIGRVSCVSMYGLMDELSDASVHRSLSDISPVFTDPRYKRYVLVAGDLNSSTQWSRQDLRRRDENLLQRFEAYGLVDCLAKTRVEPLEGCTCQLGNSCRHSWTRHDPRHPKLQVDYLFASEDLVARLNTCEALSPADWLDYSDHAPILATFRPS
jgi:endonuclease/exonuclease/phosphatase family metal-dependent hydrolase